MNPLRLITIAGISDLEERAASSLSVRSDVHLFMRCVDRVEVLAAIRGGQIDGIVCFGGPSWFDRQCVEEAIEREISIVIVADDPLVVLSGEQRDIPVLSLDTSPDDLVAHLAGDPGPLGVQGDREGELKNGKLVAVWGAKGAPGRTTVAIELACEMAALEPSTLLIDGDPYGGDILQLLGMTEELATVVWAGRLAHRDELSPSTLGPQLRRAGKVGPVVLPGLPHAYAWADVSEFGWANLLRAVRGIFATVVVDTGFCLEAEQPGTEGLGQGRNEMARVALSQAHQIVAVTGADPVSLKHFLRSFGRLEELVDRDAITIVVNRVSSHDRRAAAGLIMEHLGKRVAHFVPDRPEDARRAIATGLAIREAIRRSDVSEAVRELAASLGGQVEQRGLLGRIASRI